LNVDATKGDNIQNDTPGVPLTFPGASGDHAQTIGPATVSTNESGLVSGYFWNTYMYATLQNSAPGAAWTPLQTAYSSLTGTQWNGSDPNSVTPIKLPPINGPDKIPEEYQNTNLVAWLDAPGVEVNPNGKKPYNATFSFRATSYVQLNGQIMCSATWSMTIVWQNGAVTSWNATGTK
jgi:hypothetical protein